MTKVIRFIRANGGYSAGEIAGFEDAVADRLVQAGFATYHKAEAVEDLAPETAAESESEEVEEPEEAEESGEPDRKKSKSQKKRKGVKAEKETARSARPRLSTDAEPGTTYVTKDEG